MAIFTQDLFISKSAFHVFYLQRLNSNKALMDPITAPLSVPSNSPQPASSSLCRGQQQWWGRAGASVPAQFYKHLQYPLEWWLKNPLNCGPGETLMSHHSMDRRLYMANGLWWVSIHLRISANFMIITARKWRKPERTGWGVDRRQRRSTVMEISSTWSEKKDSWETK